LKGMGINHPVHRKFILREIDVLRKESAEGADGQQTPAVGLSSARSAEALSPAFGLRGGSRSPLSSMAPMSPLGGSDCFDHDVFISYRRATGSQLAQTIKLALRMKGYRVFLDVDNLGSGLFDDGLTTSVREANRA